jgi:hypothetical protein
MCSYKKEEKGEESCGNMLILKSFQCHAAINRKMVDNEQRSNDVSTQLDIYFVKSL